MKKNLALILAGGSGNRFGDQCPKQFASIAGRTILEHTLDRFDNISFINCIYVISNPDFYDRTVKIIEKNKYKNIQKILPGGRTRQESSCIGVMNGGNEFENVIIHDSVRPLISTEIINATLKELNIHSAVTVAIDNSDTIIEIDKINMVKGIPDRNLLKRVQTPQAFKLKLIQKAHQMAKENQMENTVDDCSLIIFFNLADVYIVEGSEKNIKITYPIDLLIAQEILKMQ